MDNPVGLVKLLLPLASCCFLASCVAGSPREVIAGGDGVDTVPISLDLKPGCHPFATSSECFLPYPSMFFLKPAPERATGYTLDYPRGGVRIGGNQLQVDMELFNAADGFSPAGPILVHFGRDVHPDCLNNVHQLGRSLDPASAILLFDLETGQRLPFLAEMDMNRREEHPGRYPLILRPAVPMQKGARHLVVLTRALKDEMGNPFDSPAAFAALRDKVPTVHPEIEDIRATYERYFGFLEQQGLPRDEVLLAWDFLTASEQHILGTTLSMRDQALCEIRELGIPYTIERVVDDPNPSLARLVEGEFEAPLFLDGDNVIQYDHLRRPVRQPTNGRYPFTMVIPKKAKTATAPLPLVLVGHSIFSTGRAFLTGQRSSTLHEMAEELGAVLIASDFIGLAWDDLDLFISDIFPDFNQTSMIPDRLQQSLINHLVLTELAVGALSRDPQLRLGETDLIDPVGVAYYGFSLGGIQGVSLLALSDRIQRAALAVAGVGWLNMIPQSVFWKPIKMFLDTKYPDPLMQQVGSAMMQGLFDPADPVNFTHLLFQEPLPDVLRDRSVLLLEALGDCQVPNFTTEMLARTLGLKLLSPAFVPVFGVEETPAPSTASVLAQFDLLDDDKYRPPESNLVPEYDNGVHSELIYTRPVQSQVIHFLQTGETARY